MSRCKDKEIKLYMKHDPNFVFKKRKNIYGKGKTHMVRNRETEL